MNFQPDATFLSMMDQSSHMFHAIIGLDPLGSFSGISGLGYEHTPHVYNELGRPHGPHRLSHGDGSGPTVLTLRWGMVVRTKLFDWIDDVRIGKDYRRDLFILQLSRKRLPIRLYHLSGAWPVAWTASEMDATSSAQVASEEVQIAFDSMDLVNLALLSMGVGALQSILADRSEEEVGNTMLQGFADTYAGTGKDKDTSKLVNTLAAKSEPKVVKFDKNVHELLKGVWHDYKGDKAVLVEGAFKAYKSKSASLEPGQDGDDEVGEAGGAVAQLETEYAQGEQKEASFDDTTQIELEGHASKYEGIGRDALVEIEATYNAYQAVAGHAVLSPEELKALAEAWDAKVAAAEKAVAGGDA